jgi:hypothetical protein
MTLPCLKKLIPEHLSRVILVGRDQVILLIPEEISIEPKLFDEAQDDT